MSSAGSNIVKAVHTFKAAARSASSSHCSRAFTLIELLVVISIMGLLAALAVPALKNMGKSNSLVGAQRQLLDDIGRARQLAISQHITVYMVFVPTNFFSYLPCTYGVNSYPDLNTGIGVMANPDRYNALVALTNLVDKQLSGYNFVSYGKLGDQPGQHMWHYLSAWQALPQGTFIAVRKFLATNWVPSLQIPTWQADYANGQIDNWMNISQIYGFARTPPLPFPTEVSPLVRLPCLSFDSTGRLISETDNNFTYHHAYIPLAQGSVTYGMTNKSPILTLVGPEDITEALPGNSTNVSYNVIDVDPLTGRAKLLVHQIP